MRKTFKDNKGITLITLVITIIVLLILAGVAIATLTGNSSIIENSNKAAQAYNETASEDDALLGKLENKLKEYTGTNDDSKDDDKKDDTKQGITTAEVANDTSYIGKYVNYTVPEGGDPEVKWRIFYADGMNGETVAENDRHIYLISEDYLKYDYVPTKTVNGTTYTMTKNSDYRLSFNDMYKAYSSNTCSVNITDSRIKKWMKYVDKYPNSKNENISSVAYMLDTGIWNTKYKNNSFADYAIGGPTIELFNASYKATHPNKYIEATVDITDGYREKWSTDSSYSYYIEGLSTSELNNLYVRDNKNANGMWLACPSGDNYNGLLSVTYDGDVSLNYSTITYPGLRALVCLSSNVQLVPNGDGETYDLIIK